MSGTKGRMGVRCGLDNEGLERRAGGKGQCCTATGKVQRRRRGEGVDEEKSHLTKQKKKTRENKDILISEERSTFTRFVEFAEAEERWCVTRNC